METEDFELRGDYIQLIQLLKAIGLCPTGGAAKHAVDAGLVKVDGKLEERKRRKLTRGNVVEFDGVTIRIV